MSHQISGVSAVGRDRYEETEGGKITIHKYEYIDMNILMWIKIDNM